MAKWIFDEDQVEEVFATGSVLLAPQMKEWGDVDTSIAILKTQKGKLDQIKNSRYANHGYDQRLEVFGELGMLKCDNLKETEVERFREFGTVGDKLKHSFPQRFQGRIQENYRSFHIRCGDSRSEASQWSC